MARGAEDLSMVAVAIAIEGFELEITSQGARLTTRWGTKACARARVDTVSILKGDASRLDKMLVGTSHGVAELIAVVLVVVTAIGGSSSISSGAVADEFAFHELNSD